MNAIDMEGPEEYIKCTIKEIERHIYPDDILVIKKNNGQMWYISTIRPVPFIFLPRLRDRLVSAYKIIRTGKWEIPKGC